MCNIVSFIKGALRSLCKFDVKIKVETIPVFKNELLKGRRALITGGSKGIGFAIADAFLHSGCEVVITGTKRERLDDAVRRLREAGSKVDSVIMDNSDPDGFHSICHGLFAKNGQFDILVNNAGCNDYMTFPNVSIADYNRVMDINLRGAFFLSQIMAKHMKEYKLRGNILNICSASSLRPATNPYCLSKWGLRALTLGMAKKLISDKIVVNGIAPGLTAIDRIRSEEEGIEYESNPSGRMVTKHEIANMAVILCSDLSRMIVGDVVYMTGGAGVITVDDNI